MVKEDILRILAEKKGEVLLDFIKTKIKVSSLLMSRAFRELEVKGLIKTKENSIKLTKNGQKESEIIFRKHLVLENYFKKTLDEKRAHKRAHILEHYVSEEVIKNIKKLYTLKEQGIPLTKFTLNEEGLITDINILTHGLFERIVSMGILPGEKIEIVGMIPDCVVVKIKNKKFALDNNIAKKIKIVEYEKA